MGVLYESWTQCEGNWTKSSLHLQAKNTQSTTRKGVRSWMNMQQLETRFGKKGAEAIVAHKLGNASLKEAEVRESQNAPGCPELAEYLVFDSEKIIDKEEDEVSRLFKASDAASESEASESSQSESESSNSSSSSKQKSRKTKKDKAGTLM